MSKDSRPDKKDEAAKSDPTKKADQPESADLTEEELGAVVGGLAMGGGGGGLGIFQGGIGLRH